MPRPARVRLRLAVAADAVDLAALHTAVAEHQTSRFGRGHWSTKTTEKGVLLALRTVQVFVACQGAEIVATLRLTTKKPWAINTRYFTPCDHPRYLLDMAVAPARQRQGVGMRCFQQVAEIARDAGADAIRLDAYDATAGAGPFYERCGCREVGRATYRATPLVYYEYLLS